eukprot:TRINITY_DN17301_c1_g3_i1.p1 TRINITY_DN17301_c1_g3~~TRINITY_DN17301_c1_g3_i1.p1  ORF type:complete len:207 (+),score=43.98 TRINITY_DN17301_c1_g3_i1:40-660(+)
MNTMQTIPLVSGGPHFHQGSNPGLQNVMMHQNQPLLQQAQQLQIPQRVQNIPHITQPAGTIGTGIRTDIVGQQPQPLQAPVQGVQQFHQPVPLQQQQFQYNPHIKQPQLQPQINNYQTRPVIPLAQQPVLTNPVLKPEKNIKPIASVDSIKKAAPIQNIGLELDANCAQRVTGDQVFECCHCIKRFIARVGEGVILCPNCNDMLNV